MSIAAFRRLAVLAAALGGLVPTAGAVRRAGAGEAPEALDRCNVVFLTPSTDSSGAVPIGNGEVGASVWIEPSGDLVLYLARSDSFSEACRLLKVGKVRVTLRPAPPTAFGSFHQELKLRQGRLEADLGAAHVEVFVEPDRPVVRILAASMEPFTATVTYEGWRRERRVLNGTTELSNSGWTMQGGPPSIPVVESADVLLPPERAPSALVWYHHNLESVVPATLRLQSCEGLVGAFDPILHRAFGAWIEGPGLLRDGAGTLAHAAPTTALDLRIACPSVVSPEIDRWLERARGCAREAPDPAAARAAGEAWWRAFWARSWIFVDLPLARVSADLLRVGGDASGGARFAGDLGRVGVWARDLRPSEVARLAAGGPLDPPAISARRVLSAFAPEPGRAWPDPGRLDLEHGFTLEAWIRPSEGRPARIFDCATPGAHDGFFLDAPSGRDLRLVVGGLALSPPGLESTSRATASHVFNALAALNDDAEIRASHDLSIQRFTWWDHRGTSEWVQYDFERPAEVGCVEVYWFDDTAIGGACRVPRSWRVLHLDDGGGWRPVGSDDDRPARPDAWNVASFRPVRTSALRIEVRLHEGFSGGILEWKVREARTRDVLTVGAWQHVAATCSAQGMSTLYRDGRMVAHRAPRGPTPVSQAYALQRFVTACQGRGEAPIKFNGGMFTVDPRLYDPKLTVSPDWRLWGDGYWFQNTRHPYHPMLAAGDFDLMEPLFAFYGRALPLARSRAKAWYGVEGAFFPETMTFFGAYPNQDYGWDRSGRQPGDVWCAAWKTAWNQGPELVDLMLDRWDHTLDPAFLRRELLPMAEAVLRYFDTRFRKEGGRIVIDPTQAVETFRTGVLDDMPTVAGLRSITSRLCALPQDLVEPGLRELFARLRDACPALPVEEKTLDGARRRSLAPARTYRLEGWNCENADLYAVWPFRLHGVGRDDLDVARTAYLTRRYSVDNGWGYDGNVAALLGLTEEATRSLLERCRDSHPAYRFPATWGPNYDWLPDQTHGGNLMETVQLMLLQHVGRRILLLPAWPPDWDVSFRLHAPRNTVVECDLRRGEVTRLVVEPGARRSDVEICAPFADGTGGAGAKS